MPIKISYSLNIETDIKPILEENNILDFTYGNKGLNGYKKYGKYDGICISICNKDEIFLAVRKDLKEEGMKIAKAIDEKGINVNLNLLECDWFETKGGI